MTVLFPRFHRVDPMKRRTAKIKHVFLFECTALMWLSSQNEQREAFVPAACKVPKNTAGKSCAAFLHSQLRSSICGPVSRVSAHSIPTVCAGFMSPLTGNFND